MLGGRMIYLDNPLSSLDQPEPARSVAIGRLTYSLVDEALNRWDELIAGGNRPVEQIRADLAEAWSEYTWQMGAEPTHAADLLAYLEDMQNTEVLADLRRLYWYLQSVRMIGLTSAEHALPEEAILNTFRPSDAMSLEMLKALIEEAGANLI